MPIKIRLSITGTSIGRAHLCKNEKRHFAFLDYERAASTIARRRRAGKRRYKLTDKSPI